ncbi:hypothetical protein RJ639_013520 [Escallonia herrerae]|uniref:DNA-directed RNA polymerase subunit n=1 Tax=Escallonia herrerae TaxID=1293975 RepID=A0AA89ANL5_9ASTE|nr:hypothetical protein RJ639_013520 [Escallonia herrerae]
MLHEAECYYHVPIPAKDIDKNGKVALSSVATCLLKCVLELKADERCGYFLAVTKLKSIGKGYEFSGSCYFRVDFNCRTFLPVDGEIMVGVVYAIRRSGAYLKCGPMNYVYLPARKMPGFHLVDGKNPHFLADNLSRIKNGVMIRCKVFAARWIEKIRHIEREFIILASLEGDGLGPISMPGYDKMHF